MVKSKEKKDSDPGQLFGGHLNIFGINLDLGELLTSPEKATGRLEELREKLKALGGQEALSDGEWRRGGVHVTGHIRTRGLLGDQEFHVGTAGKPGGTATQEAPSSTEVVEPPVDVFDEGEQVTIVADVPGIGLDNLDLKVQGRVFTLSTKSPARRNYRKELTLEYELRPDSLRAECRNGVLEIHVLKSGSGKEKGTKKEKRGRGTDAESAGP